MRARRLSEASLATELCDGPLPEQGSEPSVKMQLPTLVSSASQASSAAAADQRQRPLASDRQQWIESLKRGENPVVAPDSKLARLIEATDRPDIPESSQHAEDRTELAPPETQPIAVDNETSIEQMGQDLERPRSALHAGDFRGSHPPTLRLPCCHAPIATSPPRPRPLPSVPASPVTPWYQLPSETRPPPASFITSAVQASPSSQYIGSSRATVQRTPSRSRAPSLHSSSSVFVPKTPTSPLVQDSSIDDLEPSSFQLDRQDLLPHRRSSGLSTPSHLATLRTPRAVSSPAQAAFQPPSLGREHSFPLRSFARRSLSGLPSFDTHLPPPTPLFRSRRTSFASDASPLQHASMVGSYEESILRGRMSTQPSLPLEFTAQIGALGKNDCRPKHPPHVSVDFPAVYYSWSNGAGRTATQDDEPSPYVGFIDLEHKLPPPPPPRERRRRRVAQDGTDSLIDSSVAPRSPVRREKRKERSGSPLPPVRVGGCYRIPARGHLQVLIKSPSKTAVKLFLVPYDLDGMLPGMKTFVRQRAYSHGPVLESAITSTPKSPSSQASRAPSLPTRKSTKPSLRYLIQLNICCTAPNRFYLYKSIHVVFANRVPDNKERLVNDIVWPEPRYSAFKPTSDASSLARDPETSRMIEKANRRRSYAGPSHRLSAPNILDQEQSSDLRPIQPMQHDHSSMELFGGPLLRQPEALVPSMDTVQAFPPSIPSPASHLHRHDMEDSQSPWSGTQMPSVAVHANAAASDTSIFNKVERGDDRFGGLFGRASTPEPGEGLLAQRLRSVDLQSQSTESGAMHAAALPGHDPQRRHETLTSLPTSQQQSHRAVLDEPDLHHTQDIAPSSSPRCTSSQLDGSKTS